MCVIQPKDHGEKRIPTRSAIITRTDAEGFSKFYLKLERGRYYHLASVESEKKNQKKNTKF